MSRTLEFSDNSILSALYGAHNGHLRHLEAALGVEIASKGNALQVSGTKKAVQHCEDILRKLEGQLLDGKEVAREHFDTELRFLNKKKPSSKITIKTKKKDIKPRSPNQAEYLKLTQAKEMVFGLGPAGTGKTYLAVAMGASMYLNGEVERLIFTRPAVEAGENLGFLPGDLKEKVDPYLRPIYDALGDMMPFDFMMKKMEIGEIEVAPLAFMRGRTLSNAFVILDEAQNTTATQMKMFLTRMGEASRMVITGDLSQVDLPHREKSGLRDACEILDGIDDIGFMRFQKEDVVRHKLVSKIVQAYDANHD